MRERGFTLLEMLVATVIMGVAVVGLLSAISASLHNAARLTDYDRAALAAKRKMDELLLDSRLPRLSVLEGRFDAEPGSGFEGGWKARLAPYEMPPATGPSTLVLERLELEVWWMSGGRKRTIALEGFRSSTAAGLAPAGGQP